MKISWKFIGFNSNQLFKMSKYVLIEKAWKFKSKFLKCFLYFLQINLFKNKIRSVSKVPAVKIVFHKVPTLYPFSQFAHNAQSHHLDGKSDDAILTSPDHHLPRTCQLWLRTCISKFPLPASPVVLSKNLFSPSAKRQTIKPSNLRLRTLHLCQRLRLAVFLTKHRCGVVSFV